MVAALVGVIALGGACGDDDADNGDNGDNGASTTTATGAPPGDSATTSPGSDTDARVTASIEVRGGEVVGGAERVRVGQGEQVRLEVTSDVADEVHVHGYDHLEPVDAGGTVVVEFVADVPGVWEVELEGRGLVLAQLEVR